MKNYALIETATTLVANILVWDGKPPWAPSDGCIAVAIPEGSNAGISWTYVDGEFIGPPEPDSEFEVTG